MSKKIYAKYVGNEFPDYVGQIVEVKTTSKDGYKIKLDNEWLDLICDEDLEFITNKVLGDNIKKREQNE